MFPDARLTTPAGDDIYQYHREAFSRDEAPQLVGIGMAEPTDWSYYHLGVVRAVPPGFPPGPRETQHGLLFQSPPPTYVSGHLTEGPDVLFPGGGEFLNPAVLVDCNPPDGNPWPDYGDPGSLPRCGTYTGTPIHLTTNISMVSSQVSYPYLFEEVCHYSVRKASWY